MSILLYAVVCKISISYHTETMGNRVTQLTFTCLNSTLNTRERCEICSKVTMKTLEQLQ